jgi:threonine efflux protein
METTVVLVSVFAIFIPALILPGPDFVAVVRSSVTRGTAAGLLTTLGVSTGLGFYASLSLLGLSSILAEYQWLAWLVRILGAGYLIYLGIRLLFSKPHPVEIPTTSERRYNNAFLFGLMVTLTNPKAIVLFTSVFATSVSLHTPLWLMVLMIGLVVASSLAWYSLVSLLMSSPPVTRRLRASQHWIERAAGVCFVAIGVRVLADARTPIGP